MNSSPDSAASTDEIVFVPLMIDESDRRSMIDEPPARLRSYRRKPKHPQKLTQLSSQQHQQPQQQQTQQLKKCQQPQRESLSRKRTSSDYSSEDPSSGGESENENNVCFYFGEQSQNSYGDQTPFSSE